MAEIVEQELSYAIVGEAYKVRDELGTGFLEKVYENALIVGLREIGLRVEQQVPIEVRYHGQIVGTYFADLIVEGRILIEVKVAERISRAHLAQTRNCLQATGLKLGIVINFNKERVDVERVVN